MFTGIVQELGTVKSLEGGHLAIQASKVLEGTKTGDSIAVNGACLTVVAMGNGGFTTVLMPETLRRTSLGTLHLGDPVNLERALAMGEPMGGHIVQGHVEGTGTIISMIQEGDAVLARYRAPKELLKYIVSKGFIAVDGVSLTVVSLDEDTFTVSLVEYTQQHTNLTRHKLGDLVNLETDVIARYVERLLGQNHESPLNSQTS